MDPVQAQQAASEAVPYALRWSREPGAEGCIDVDSIARHLSRSVGYPAVATAENETRIDGRTQPNQATASEDEIVLDGRAQGGRAITADNGVVLDGRARPGKAPNRFQIHLRVLDARGEPIGERVLSTQKAECSALNSALLLVLAMSLNPNSASERRPAEIAQAPNPEGQGEMVQPRDDEGMVTVVEQPKLGPRPLSSTVKLTKLVFERSPLPRQRWLVFGGPAFALGVVPQPTLGFLARLRRELPVALSASLAVATWVPRAAHLDAPWSISGKITVAAMQLRGAVCRQAFERSGVALQACAGGHWGIRWFSSDAFERQFFTTRQFYGPSFGMEGAVSLSSRVSLRGAVELAAQFPRDRFTYATAAGTKHPLYRPSLLASDTFVGVEVTL